MQSAEKVFAIVMRFYSIELFRSSNIILLYWGRMQGVINKDINLDELDNIKIVYFQK